MKLKLIFLALAVLTLAPWPVAYAYDANKFGRGREAAYIEVAEASNTPTYNVFARAIGGVKPGDLFYVNAAGNPADIVVSLYLTNAAELVRSYNYLILKVSVYVEDGARGWRKAVWWDGTPIPEAYITMVDAQAQFNLTGDARYKVALDGGSFYCTDTRGSVAPQFYLKVD